MARLFAPAPIKTPMLDKLGLPTLPWKKFFASMYDLIGGESASSTSIPTGTISAFGGTSAPDGWLLCDGTSYSVGSYPTLHSTIGDAFGGDGGSNFNVPDLRGRFLRGVDGAAGRDPDDSTRTAMNTGGNTGDAVGSVQAEAYKGHTHSLSGTAASSGNHDHGESVGHNGPSYPWGNKGITKASMVQGTSLISANVPLTENTGAHTHSVTGTATSSGGNETRPINAGVNFIIKT